MKDKYQCNYNNNIFTIWCDGKVMLKEYISQLDLVEDRISELEEAGLELTCDPFEIYLKQISERAV